MYSVAVKDLRDLALRLPSLRMHYRLINGQHSNGKMQLGVVPFGIWCGYLKFSLPEFGTKMFLLSFCFLSYLCLLLRGVSPAAECSQAMHKT